MGGRVLITGGGGLVGRNLLDHPRLTAWTVAAPRRAQLDLTDAAATRAFVADFAPDLIIHAAGRVGGIQANMAAPVSFLVENLDIGRNIVLAAFETGVPRLLNLGSSCIYPRNRETPLREEDMLTGELEPTNEGYALAKIVALRLCQYVGQQAGNFHYKTLIPCNLYGRYDHFGEAVSHLVPAVIKKMHDAKVRGARTVEIWGDGTVRREFMYAGDLADAIMRAADDFDAVPDLMNVGIGSDHSIREYYETAAEVVGWTGSFTFDTSKPIGMKRKLVDISRQTAWGWQPATSLRDGIAAAYDYFLEEQQ